MARKSMPSIVPNDEGQNVHLVVHDSGRNGWVYRKADVEETNVETVVLHSAPEAQKARIY